MNRVKQTCCLNKEWIQKKQMQCYNKCKIASTLPKPIHPSHKSRPEPALKMILTFQSLGGGSLRFTSICLLFFWNDCLFFVARLPLRTVIPFHVIRLSLSTNFPVILKYMELNWSLNTYKISWRWLWNFQIGHNWN